MKALELKFPENIYVTPNRSTTIWGGTSYLSMLIGCFKDLLQKPWEWDFVLNLSETDYPLKKREDFVEFLTSNRDKNFVLERGLENPQRHSSWIKNMGKKIPRVKLLEIKSLPFFFKPIIMNRNNSTYFFIF
jgi:hypothetical protein